MTSSSRMIESDLHARNGLDERNWLAWRIAGDVELGSISFGARHAASDAIFLTTWRSGDQAASADETTKGSKSAAKNIFPGHTIWPGQVARETVRAVVNPGSVGLQAMKMTAFLSE